MSQAEWEAAATKFSGRRIYASKKRNGGLGRALGQCKASSGFARDSDLDTIRRCEHADMRFALGQVKRLGEVDEGRTGRCADDWTVGDFVQSYRGLLRWLVRSDVVGITEKRSLALRKAQKTSKLFVFQGGLFD